MRTTTTTRAKDIFLRFSWYYKRFMKHFSKIARPMHNLMTKESKFEWNEKCEEAFQTLKERLTSPPVLTVPDGKEGFEVYSDTSKNGLGCVLQQDGKVIAYASRQLKPYDRVILPMTRARCYCVCIEDLETLFVSSTLQDLY